MLQAPYCPSVLGNHIPKCSRLKTSPGLKLQRRALGYPESWKGLEEPGERQAVGPYGVCNVWSVIFTLCFGFL